MPNHETKIFAELAGRIQLLSRDVNSQTCIASVGSGESRINELVKLLRSSLLKDIHGYFCNRRAESCYSELDEEAKIQDILYCIVRPLIEDLHYENPSSKPQGGLGHRVVDFSSSKHRIWIEAKHVSSKTKAKTVEKEISEDITSYGRTGGFDFLVFFVYCHKYNVPNRAEFEKGLTGPKSIDGNSFETICILY